MNRPQLLRGLFLFVATLTLTSVTAPTWAQIEAGEHTAATTTTDAV